MGEGEGLGAEGGGGRERVVYIVFLLKKIMCCKCTARVLL